MNALTTAVVAFALVMGGALLGGFLRSVLPKHHLSEDSKDMVKVGIGFLATLAALVLGLLLASAKSTFDRKAEEVDLGAAKIILLDRNLRQFGPEADPARDRLRWLVVSRGNLASLSTEGAESKDAASTVPAAIGIEEVQERIRALTPQNDAQRAVRERALQLAQDLAQLRWVLLEQSGSTFQAVFMVVLVCWLAAIAASLSLFAPRNATLLGVTLVCALSFASAIFLILELDRPFDGLLRLSDAPLRNAIEYLSR